MQKFIIDGPVEKGANIRISGQDARHICRVLRLRTEDALSMTDGRGMDYTGRITGISPDRADVCIVEIRASSTESPLDLTLCSAMLKHNKMDEIIKQVTQLGVTRWVPFFSARSVPASNPKKEKRQMERWQTIARESLKQCRRSRTIRIEHPMTFEAMLDLTQGVTRKIAFWENAARPLGQLANETNAEAVVLIGPEGGFEAREIEAAERKGFAAYALGPRILRAETAAVSAAALVQYLLGDMGGGPPP